MNISITRVSKQNVSKLNHRGGAAAVTSRCVLSIGEFAVTLNGKLIGSVWSYVSEEPGMSGKRWGWEWDGQDCSDDLGAEYTQSHVFGVKSKRAAVNALLIMSGAVTRDDSGKWIAA